MEAMEISEELVAAGIPEPQAKAIAKTQVASARAAAKQSTKGLSTKEDIARLEGLVEKGLSDLKTEIRASENRQLWRAIVIMVAMTAIFSYIVKGF